MTYLPYVACCKSWCRATNPQVTWWTGCIWHLREMLEHPNQEKYPGQKILIVQVDDYVYAVPFVETEIFLKTIIPSRKATRKYRSL